MLFNYCWNACISNLNGPFVFKVEMRKLNDEIKGKNEQIALLEKQIADSIAASHNKMDKLEISQVSSLFTFLYKLYRVLASNYKSISKMVVACCSLFLNWWGNWMRSPLNLRWCNLIHFNLGIPFLKYLHDVFNWSIPGASLRHLFNIILGFRSALCWSSQIEIID